jgi:hypothetical protein
MKLKSMTTGKFTIPCDILKESDWRRFFGLPYIKVRYLIEGLNDVEIKTKWVWCHDICYSC